MTIGPDIKEVLAEVGVSFSVIREGGDLTGEYLDYEPNRQVTKPFIREYFLEAMLAHDTQALAGDVLTFSDGRSFLIMNKTLVMFEDAGINYDAVLYKCNVSGELLRPSDSGEWNAVSYQREHSWNSVKDPAYGLLTEKMFGTDLLQDEELGQIGVESQVLYLPHSYGVQPLDRFVAVSGEFYKIEEIESRKFDNVDVCHIAEDTRE